MFEYLYLVDKKDKVLGKIERREAHKKGLLHRGGVVFVFNSKGQLFLTERSPKKDIFPNRVDSACSFHVTFGESYDKSAKREVLEETKLKEKPVYLGKILVDKRPDRMIMAVYKICSDKKLVLDPREAIGGKFYPKKEVGKIIKNEKTTSWLKEAWKKYGKREMEE